MCNYYIYIYLITSAKHQTLALLEDNSVLPLRVCKTSNTNAVNAALLAALFVCSLVFISSSFSFRPFHLICITNSAISRTVSDKSAMENCFFAHFGMNVPSPLSASSSFRLPVRIVFCSRVKLLRRSSQISIRPLSVIEANISEYVYDLTIVRENRKCVLSSYAASYLPATSLALFELFHLSRR